MQCDRFLSSFYPILSVANSSLFRNFSMIKYLCTLSIHRYLGRLSGFLLFGMRFITWTIVCSRRHHTCPAQPILFVFHRNYVLCPNPPTCLLHLYSFLLCILPCFGFFWGQKFIVILFSQILLVLICHFFSWPRFYMQLVL